MKACRFGLLVLIAVLAACGEAPTANLPAGLPALPEQAEEPQPKRYPAYSWPPDFNPPLEIEIETVEVPPEIVGPTKLRR